MRDLIRSVVNLSVAMPLLAMKQAGELWRGRDGADSLAGDLDSLTDAVKGQLEGTARDVYEGGERLQAQVFGNAEPKQPEQAAPEKAAANEGGEATKTPQPGPAEVRSGDLDLRSVVVLGEGLAAGFGDFSLAEEYQRESFAAQLAAQMGASLTRPDVESPGLGDAPGYQRLPVMVPALMQTTALSSFPPSGTPRNLALPGYRVADALSLRPVAPLVHQGNARQTLANLALGLPELLAGGEAMLPTQLERALAHQPSFAIVELGFYETLEAAVAGRPGDIPEAAAFSREFGQVVAPLAAAGARVLVLTIPDPVDTAYFSSLESAAANLKVTSTILAEAFGLEKDDRVSVPALMEMGCQLLAETISPLPEGGILKGAVAAEIGARVVALNDAIRAVAAAHGAEVFDLAALYKKVAAEGVQVGGRRLTADFLGGFYLLNGYYPGATGHAVIANAILAQLNRDHGASFRAIDLEQAQRRDPAAGHRPAGGPVLSGKKLHAAAGIGVTEVAHRRADTPAAPAKRSAKGQAKPAAKGHGKPGVRLELPPGLEQRLPLSKAASYFGDSIRAAHCRKENEQVFGSGREQLFGGLAMVDSHLSGEIHIRFGEPEDDVTHFEVRHGKLEGDNGTLTAPQFFKLPSLRNQVSDDASLVSQGDLNLATGEVTNLKYAVGFFNTALLALMRVNPKLPVAAIEFPGLYGSADAKFEQRADGLLDFTFYGTTFLPLGGALEGDPVRFPLPLAGPSLEFASITAPGTSLHPHIHLSTKDPEPAPDPALVPEIPVNTVREYTIFTRQTSFGDKFTLNSPELAGDPTGRSHLLGRVQVQFGPASGDSVPVAVSCLNPGGVLTEPTPSPLADVFPGRLPPSPIGHNEFLRFATRTYYLDALTCIDDPFDLSVGNVSRASGRLLSDLLHRALIGQNLFYALIRVEPRTPKSSFFFRGPAHFEKGRDGRPVFRFAGQVMVPYPEGYLFPSPDMAKGVVIGSGSQLDPFYWIQAMQHDRASDAVLSGQASNVVSSANEQFSYKYEIGGDLTKTKPVFEYTNHTVDGVFRLKSLTWVGFANSRGAGREGGGAFDTVTFAGFGTWSRDASGGLHLVCAQICASPATPYVSIQIGGGRVSNVNTRPPKLEDVRP
jgi:hypothetical protein